MGTEAIEAVFSTHNGTMNRHTHSHTHNSRKNSSSNITNNTHDLDLDHNRNRNRNHSHTRVQIPVVQVVQADGGTSSPMSFAHSNSSVSTNPSKENLEVEGYQYRHRHQNHHNLAQLRNQRSTEYDDGTSTGSRLSSRDRDRDRNHSNRTTTDEDDVTSHSSNSNFTSMSRGSKSSAGGTGGLGGGMIRSKTRLIFSSSEKFQSHPDLKDLYDKEEERERCEGQLQLKLQNQGEGDVVVGLGSSEEGDDMAIEVRPPVKLVPTKFFGKDINAWTNGNPDELTFDKEFRNFIDIHIAKARRNREEKYKSLLKKIGVDESTRGKVSTTVASNAYVPYPALRNERRFLYDVDTYPLHQYLADILGVSDLSLIHQHPIQDKKQLLKPLLDSRKRKAFHQCYDNFVSSFCIPLLHSLAMESNLFNIFTRRDNAEQQKIYYRYQAFPCIRVNRPGEFSIGPHCDMAYGHSMGNINFHIPLTPTYGTNALYAETHPGREDWHPFKTKSIGLGYSFDGARCLHFTTENTTMHTRVSLDFRIAIHRERKIEQLPPSVNPSNARMMMEYSVLLKDALNNNNKEENNYDVHDVLCNRKILQDNYSSFPGYYEEAYVELGTSLSCSSKFGPGPVVCKRNGATLMQPDKRVGFPF